MKIYVPQGFKSRLTDKEKKTFEQICSKLRYQEYPDHRQYMRTYPEPIYNSIDFVELKYDHPIFQVIKKEMEYQELKNAKKELEELKKSIGSIKNLLDK